MGHLGWFTLIAGLIALGLILRYGQSSNYLAADFFNGTNSWFKTLSLQNFGGNTPSGGSMIH